MLVGTTVYYRILFENFSVQDMKSKRNATGIQMVGVMAANKLVPWRPSDGIDKTKYQHLKFDFY